MLKTQNLHLPPKFLVGGKKPKTQINSKITNPKKSGLKIEVWDLRFDWKLGLGNWGFQQGFTLLEMIISIGIFSVLAVASIGIMIGVSKAEIKAANIQATQDNIRFGLELMTKEMRTGTAYQLSHFCSPAAGEEISFLTSGGERRVYYRAGTRIMRRVGTTDCAGARPLLADEVEAKRLKFRIGGGAPGAADGQPWVAISLSVRSQDPKEGLESEMDLQTSVVQRLRDL